MAFFKLSTIKQRLLVAYSTLRDHEESASNVAEGDTVAENVHIMHRKATQ